MWLGTRGADSTNLVEEQQCKAKYKTLDGKVEVCGDLFSEHLGGAQGFRSCDVPPSYFLLPTFS